MKITKEEDTGVKKYGSKKKAKDDVVESMCPGHFQKPETPWSGGSILQSMDDMVKNGEVIIMGDFNEVRKKAERFGSVFIVQGADAFNMFISNAGLEEVPLGNNMRKLKADLAELDAVIDKGEGDEDVVNKRANFDRSLQELEKLQSVEVAQKAKDYMAIRA
ncbi:RNA-directed DNA polymerase, eukaryota [Tanacetum coccineum]